jgi:hypothetical protein
MMSSGDQLLLKVAFRQHACLQRDSMHDSTVLHCLKLPYIRDIAVYVNVA